MWNADADVDALIEEFTDGYYGAGGKYIRQYIALLCDAAYKEGDHVGFNDKPLHKFLDEKYLDQYEAIFAQAGEAVKDDVICLWRVEKAALSIRYVRLMRGFLLKGQLPKEELNRFFGEWESFGLSRMEEWCSRDTTRKALLRGESVGAFLYEHWTDEGPEIL